MMVELGVARRYEKRQPLLVQGGKEEVATDLEAAN
jgi:hypothetical protein